MASTHSQGGQPTPLESRLARLFKNGSNLAVRIPVDWRLSSNEVVLSWDGQNITITPAKSGDDLKQLFAEFAADPLTEEQLAAWHDPDDSVAEPVII